MAKSKASPKVSIIKPMANSKEPPMIQKVEEYLRERYQFRYNVVTGRISWRTIDSNSFSNLSDYDFNTIHSQMLRDSINCSQELVSKLLHSGFSPRYNPIKDYLSNLGIWNGKTDHILDLARTVTVNDPKFWEACLKKWLVAYVASLLNDETVNHTALILVGEQGVGKSQWIEKLVPKQLIDYKYSGMICPGQKDTEIKLSECILIISDELNGLTRGSLEGIKEMITKTDINIRRPYNQFSERLIRRASFAGSVNRTDFLKDETGNRRFLCFYAEAIDNCKNVSIDDVLSQAVSLYNEGFQYWFDQSEIAALNANNEQYRQITTEEERFNSVFRPAKDKDKAGFVGSSSDILDQLSKVGGINNCDRSKIALGRILGALKVPHFKRNGRKVYALDFISEKFDEKSSVAQAAMEGQVG